MMVNNIRPYEWMIKFTPQREWIEGCGICLWLAFVLGGIGGGLYLISLYFNSYIGLIIGWLIAVVLKGGIHLFELGKPSRAWRVFFRPQASWISRGIIAVTGFAIFGALQLAPAIIPELPWSSESIILRTLAALFAFFMLIYPGFVMNYIKAIPLWNNALLPVLYLVYSLLDGCGLSMILSLVTGTNKATLLELAGANIWLLAGVIVVVSVFLVTANYTNVAARESFLVIVKGHLMPLFYTGVLVLGIMAPLVIFTFSYLTGSVLPFLFTLTVICQLVGSLSIRFCLLKAGLYTPLVPGKR